MQLRPFPALRPATPDLARRIASLPYDVMDTEEARAMAAGNPDCFLHVVRSEIDLPVDTDSHADIVYRQARAALDALAQDGRLVQEREPSLYVYRQTMGQHRQTAVVACCRIDDYANNVILKHEKTRKDKEDDRTHHILATNANTGQVFLTYADDPAIDGLVAAETAHPPLYDFTAVDGIGHTVWKVTDAATLLAAFGTVPRAYIADGHHRSAASYRAGLERRAGDPNHTGSEEYNGFMACLFPASQLRILPYNRLLLSLNGLTPEQLLAEVSKRFDVSPTSAQAPAAPRASHLYLAGRWHRLAWKVDADASPVARLDVSVLQDRLLAPVLGIVDPRTDQRIAFVGGVRGTDELVRKVDGGQAAAAFSMYPTTVAEMMAIADAGQIMPPKSTWFEPKLRSGLLVHRLG
jgi:uncharacterized protein (DUF1015 family)